MKSRKIGILIFTMGTGYMLLVGWLMSWWIVPGYREFGPEFLSKAAWYNSNWFFLLWAISVPVGSVLTVLGLGLYSGLERVRILFFVLGSMVLLAWLGFWTFSAQHPVLYGIGGGVILLSFLASCWQWAKTRPSLSGRLKTVADLRVLSYVFFFIAAWVLCGLLGTPVFGLRPELMLRYQTSPMAITMAAKVFVCLVLGWVFIALSQRMELLAQNKDA